MSLNVELLEKSFGQIKPQASEFVTSFYATLLTDNPQRRPMFAHANMAEQKKKLVGVALLETFETFLGADWTVETRQAWIDAYGVISSVMVNAAGEQRKSA